MKFTVARDSWFSKLTYSDKIMHFVGGFALFSFIRHHCDQLGTWILILAAGWLWEVKDGFLKDGFSWKDGVAVMGGAVLSWLFIS